MLTRNFNFLLASITLTEGSPVGWEKEMGQTVGLDCKWYSGGRGRNMRVVGVTILILTKLWRFARKLEPSLTPRFILKRRKEGCYPE